MWEKLRRFSALERPAQKLFLRALAMLPSVSLSLQLRGLQATQATLQKILPTPFPGQKSGDESQRVALTSRMVDAADRHGLVHPSCLAKSLTLWWLLARQGITSHLRIGIRREAETFEAHAWVEREGAAVNEPEGCHHHYAAFDAAISSLPEEHH